MKHPGYRVWTTNTEFNAAAVLTSTIPRGRRMPSIRDLRRGYLRHHDGRLRSDKSCPDSNGSFRVAAWAATRHWRRRTEFPDRIPRNGARSRLSRDKRLRCKGQSFRRSCQTEIQPVRDRIAAGSRAGQSRGPFSRTGLEVCTDSLAASAICCAAKPSSSDGKPEVSPDRIAPRNACSSST